MTETTPQLLPTELEAWITLMAFFETVPPMIDGQLKQHAGVNLFEYTIMAMLSEHAERTLQMTALADISFGSISRLSHAVGRLEERGWVEKRAGEGSRRHNVVHLTKEGMDALAAAAPNHIAEVRRLVAEPLTANEIRSFTTTLQKILGAANPALLALLNQEMGGVIERNS